MGEQVGNPCSVCGGYGYTYRIGNSGSSRTVQQLLGKSSTRLSGEDPGDVLDQKFSLVQILEIEHPETGELELRP